MARISLPLSFLLGACITATVSAQARPAAAQAKTVWPGEGPLKWAPRPTTPEISANDLRTRLYQFSDDSMAGRRIGEPGNHKGTDYIAREFRRMGLKPGGDAGGYFQDLPFGPTGFDSATSRLIAGGATLVARADWVPMVPSAGNGLGGQASFADVPAVFAGRWGDTSVMLDPAVFKGKVAVFLEASSTVPAGAGRGGRGGATVRRCDSLPDRFGAAAAVIADAAAAVDTSGGRGGRASRGGGGGGRAGGGRGGAQGGVRDMRAENAGAVAVLVVAVDGISSGAANAAFNGRGGMQPATPLTNASPVSGATISRSAAARLFDKPLDQLTVGAAGQRVTASWSYEWRMSRTPARNVVAILPGSDPVRAAEYVLVSAHNDHNGVAAVAVDHDSLRAVNTITRRQGANDPVCRPTDAQQHQIDSLIARARSIRPARRDSVNNGADDDGSGTVVLLEIAERFATEKPARSIIFVSHEGEEGGMLGSKWFTDHPTVPLTSIVAAHNMDMLAKGRVEEVKFGGPTSIQTLGARRLSREFGDIIDSVNATRVETMAIDRSWDVTANPMNRFCRSDQVNYVNNNVPVTYFSTGYAQDYHQVTDEAQYVDYDHAARIGRFVHDIMMAIANRRDRPVIAGPDPAYPACRRGAVPDTTGR